MSGKIIPWKRKPKVKQLEGGLHTGMTFAVIGNEKKFNQGHAGKVYRLLKELGAQVYAVGADLDSLGQDKVFPNILELPLPVEAVIPCLPAEYSLGIVEHALQAGINKIWFQNRTLSPEAIDFCLNNHLEIIEGCVLKFKDFKSMTKFASPCYWHLKTIALKTKYL